MPVRRPGDEREPWPEFSPWSLKEGTGELSRFRIGSWASFQGSEAQGCF